MFTAYLVKSWTVLAVLAVLLVVVNWVYFSKRMIPAKYLVPGMVFLLIYQVFVMGYTGYVSFTNYGQGHNSTKEDAVASILRPPNSAPPAPSTFPPPSLRMVRAWAWPSPTARLAPSRSVTPRRPCTRSTAPSPRA